MVLIYDELTETNKYKVMKKFLQKAHYDAACDIELLQLDK